MMYLLLKFLHVVFAIVWLGGVITLTVFNLLLLRAADRPFLVSLTRYSQLLGVRLTAPAAGLTMLTGFGAVGVGHTGFPLWVLWGIAAFVLAIGVGATVFRRAGMEFGRLLARPDSDDRAIAAGQRRMAVQQLIMILLLLSTVWAMVFKPTL